VNNAGIMKLSSIADTDDASFERQIAVNLKGTFNTLREAAKSRATLKDDTAGNSGTGLLNPSVACFENGCGLVCAKVDGPCRYAN
jgi:3-oxoacyl-[acyl-carrier protein] reductase